MPTEWSDEQFEFEGLGRRRVVAACDGGAVSSNGGALLLRHADRALGLIDRVAACFVDRRAQDQVVHTLPAPIGQRIVGIAPGYEDVSDHDDLRHDPVLALLAARLEPKRMDCAPLAGKSTLNRLEHAPLGPDDRYHRIDHDPQALANPFVDLFLDAHKRPPKRIILDLDATDDPLHGEQEGRRSARPTALRSTFITAATAICHCMCSAAGICSRPGCGPRISMPRLARWRRWPGSRRVSGRLGRGSGFCCGPIRVLLGTS